MKKAIFPKFNIMTANCLPEYGADKVKTTLNSVVRVKCKGIWYEVEHFDHYISDKNNANDIIRFLQAFMENCYRSKYLLQVDEAYMERIDSCKKSKIQMSERDRVELIALLGLNPLNELI